MLLLIDVDEEADEDSVEIEYCKQENNVINERKMANLALDVAQAVLQVEVEDEIFVETQ
jgi:hypothetical protein